MQNYERQIRTTVRLTAANASLLFPAQVANNGTVTVERVTLSRGGFLRLTANNETVGTTGRLSQVTNSSVDVQLNTSLDGPTNLTATAIVDANENGMLDGDGPSYESEPNATSNAMQTTAAPTTTEVTVPVNDEKPLAPIANNSGESDEFVRLSPVTALVAIAAGLVLAARRGPDRL